jgi:hypothetical protein
MKDCKVIKNGTNSDGDNWILVETNIKGFRVRYWAYPETLEDYPVDAKVQIPEEALSKVQ